MQPQFRQTPPNSAFFHYGGFQAVLRGLYRGHISSGAAAYYDNIVFHFLFVLM